MAKSSSNDQRKYRPGEIYSFKTQPTTRFSPPDTGRYGALKILGPTDEEGVCYVVLDGVFASPPTPQQVADLRPMHDRRWTSESNGHIVWEDGFMSIGVHQQVNPINDLPELRLVTSVDLTTADHEIKEKNTSFSGWGFAATAVEVAWRKRNDNELFQAEWAKEEEARKRDWQTAEHRRNTRLKKLTPAQLRSEPVLPLWNATRYPPAEFADVVRARILETIDALQNLGERPRRPTVRKTLAGFVEWLNEQDEAFNHPIETTEREHLCEVIEELCWAAGQPALVKEIQDLRDW
jgi:hypothetical protein